jgi:secreted protein with Ig-like and vWFA domain
MAATELANNMTSLDQMGLVSFSTSATLNAGLKTISGDSNGANKTNPLNAIDSLNANGGTDVYTGIQKARDEFAAHGRPGVKHVAILLSDGYSQSPDKDI